MDLMTNAKQAAKHRIMISLIPFGIGSLIYELPELGLSQSYSSISYGSQRAVGSVVVAKSVYHLISTLDPVFVSK